MGQRNGMVPDEGLDPELVSWAVDRIMRNHLRGDVFHPAPGDPHVFSSGEWERAEALLRDNPRTRESVMAICRSQGCVMDLVKHVRGMQQQRLERSA